jgi:uncharacterized protein (DUF2344 family)
MPKSRYYLDTKKSDLLKLNVYDNDYLDKELERIITQIEMGNLPAIDNENISRKTKVKIDKNDLEYNKETQASELFNIKQRFKRRAAKIADMIKEKQTMSRVDMIGKLDRLDYKFGPHMTENRFSYS